MVNKKNNPRILIFSQTFNDFSGGGITLSNLFEGYPKDKISVLSYPFMLFNVSFKLCDNYYQIGREEYYWSFPLSLIKKNYDSGIFKTEKKEPVSKREKIRLRRRLSSGLLTPFLRWTGLFYCVSRIEISDRLKKWLSDNNPQILYLQISNRESIIFSRKLIEYLKIPTILHMMDDWPTTISRRGLFKKYWQKRINNEFIILLEKIDLYLSISDAMSDEYLQRYGKIFRAFHNPINPERFCVEASPSAYGNNRFRILYVGRIGMANQNSLISFANFISRYDSIDGLAIEFHIYTKDVNTRYAKTLKGMKGICVNEAINHSEIPRLLKSHDLLLLPLDFSESGLRFSRFSMPTKASEYMMSGTPILVYAPEETAISQFCRKNECAHCVNSTDEEELAESLDLISQNRKYREQLAHNAMNYAKELFDVRVVRKEFQKLLIKLNS